jgi:staphylococcal nuclease domain-containing protein 1
MEQITNRSKARLSNHVFAYGRTKSQVPVYPTYKGAQTHVNSTFEATVNRIVGPDLLLIEPTSGKKKEMKVQLSSVRGPKRAKNAQQVEVGYYLDAIEFLRSRLIGETVTVTIDYVKPQEGEYEERTCVTIMKGTQNIGESLVSRGLATVLRHRKDDDSRSPFFDRLIEAEERAKVAAKNLHSTAEPPVHRVSDASENATKARSFLQQLQRQPLSGIVEFVSSASRFKVNVPSKNLYWLLT